VRSTRRRWIEALESRCLLTTLYVDAHAPTGTHNGIDWSHAYLDLQQAFSSAFSGDTIRVADGTYKPGSGTITTVTFQLKNGVTIQGGYAGYGAPNPDARDVTANKTILSGLLSTSGSITYYAQHVVTGSGTNSTAVLDGFTITQGNSTSGAGNNGGGLYNVSGSPTINDCTFLSNCARINSQTGGGFGGAIYNSASSPNITNCTLLENQADSGGGAIYNTNSSAPKFTSCLISHNSTGTSGLGGGIYNDTTSAALFTGCTISWNSCGSSSSTGGGGGGLYNANSAAKFTNCTFLHNSVITFSTGGGGAVYCTGAASPIFVQCIFDGNRAPSGGSGGAIDSASGSAPTFTNSTFTSNSVVGSNHGAAIYQSSAASPVLTNCILYGNTSIDPTPIFINTGSASVNVTYSDVQGGASGTGNINVDPVFTNAAGVDGVTGNEDDDLRLRPSSPAADAGNKNASGLTGITTDLAGAPRFTDIPTAPDTGLGTAPLVDMGAYEAQPGMVTDAFGPYYVAAGGSISLKSYGYSDQPGTLSYSWDLNGDGIYDDATGPNPTFSAAGMTGPATITIGLQITDTASHTKRASATLKIIPHVIYVDDSAPGANNGGSWTDAYRSLAAAMQDALVGTEIHVAQGTYHATDDNDPSKSLAMKNGEQLLGGYAGYGAANPDARDTIAHPAILSGDIGTVGDNSDNTYRILLANLVDNTTTIDGLTFTGGNASVFDFFSGSAILVTAASPAINNCTFKSNTAIDAPLNLNGSSSLVTNCLFIANSSTLEGGAVRINPAPSSGDPPPTPGTPLRLADCVFIGNSAPAGGAIFSFLTFPQLSPQVIIDGCVFSNNKATTDSSAGIISDGGAIDIFNSPPQSTSPTITNSIFWQNTSPSGTTINGSATISFCGGSVSGFTGFSGDPKFVRNPSSGADSIWGTADDDLGDLHLQSTSPAIDAGFNGNVPTGITLDFAGNPRFADISGMHDPGVIVDIGAYEATAALLAKNISLQSPPQPSVFQVVFNENLDPASVESKDLSFSNIGTGQTIDGASVTAASYNSATFTSVWALTSSLPDGNYHATLGTSSISDAADHSTNASGISIDFFFLSGDANHDRTVNMADFNALAANFNKTSVGLSGGDFNLDGKVNLIDLNMLASNFGATLATPAAPVAESLPSAQSSIPNLFSDTQIAPLSRELSLL
jgi:hypothetical protein